MDREECKYVCLYMEADKTKLTTYCYKRLQPRNVPLKCKDLKHSWFVYTLCEPGQNSFICGAYFQQYKTAQMCLCCAPDLRTGECEECPDPFLHNLGKLAWFNQSIRFNKLEGSGDWVRQRSRMCACVCWQWITITVEFLPWSLTRVGLICNATDLDFDLVVTFGLFIVFWPFFDPGDIRKSYTWNWTERLCKMFSSLFCCLFKSHPDI